jgi:hypothetical protein
MGPALRTEKLSIFGLDQFPVNVDSIPLHFLGIRRYVLVS